MLKLLDNDFAYHVTRVHALSEQVSQLFLLPQQAALSFVAGQYVHVKHLDNQVSLLSIACAPHEKGELEFHLFHPENNLLAVDLMRIAKQEKRWLIRGPFGQSTVDKLQAHMPIIFLARGTGFAPVKAVIEDLTVSSTCPPISLYWFMPQRGAFYLQDLLSVWQKKSNFTYHLIPDHHQTDFSSVIKQHQDLSSTQVYASGSPDFVHSAYPLLQSLGLQRGLFVSDVFE